MIKIIIIDKTFRHLGCSFREEIKCVDIEIARAMRKDILRKARDYGAIVKVVIEND